MKKFIEADITNFEIINGRIICPTGDYTAIKKFKGNCSFGVDCNFGMDCSFGERCSFGVNCSFGECCMFGEYCSFGECCSFGERCSFEKGYMPIDYKRPYYKFAGFGSRHNSELYYYRFTAGNYIRAGCWFGNTEEFKKRVIDEKADKRYLKLIDFLEML